ncbi:MAG: hypothetical protein IIA19_00725 [Thaumarchaeota archaeon]|nr:hypothetical protein [Nitrososphaerota archaeon]
MNHLQKDEQQNVLMSSKKKSSGTKKFIKLSSEKLKKLQRKGKIRNTSRRKVQKKEGVLLLTNQN